MHGLADSFFILSPEKLGNNHSSAGGKPHKKAHHQIDDHGSASTHGRQGLLAHIAANDHGVRRIVKLLKKRPKQNGKEKQQKLFPYHALCDGGGPFCGRLPVLRGNPALH